MVKLKLFSKRADHVNIVNSTCFCCWDDLSYGLNTLGQLCLWQCLIFRHRLASSLVCSDWPSIIIEAVPQIHLSIQNDCWELNDLHGWCSIPLSSNCFHSCRVSRDRTTQSIVRCITTVRQRERHKTAVKQCLFGRSVFKHQAQDWFQSVFGNISWFVSWFGAG